MGYSNATALEVAIDEDENMPPEFLCERRERLVPVCKTCEQGQTYNLRPDGGGAACHPCPANATICENPGAITCPKGQRGMISSQTRDFTGILGIFSCKMQPTWAGAGVIPAGDGTLTSSSLLEASDRDFTSPCTELRAHGLPPPPLEGRFRV